MYSSLQYSLCRHLRTLPRGQHFSKFAWTHRSINSTKIPITYPATSRTKIGATVTMLTSIVGSCSSDSFETKNCFRILSRTPLSQICANLWRKFYNIESLIRCYFKRIPKLHYSYVCIKQNKRPSVNKRCRRQCYCKVPDGIVTYSKENPVLCLDITQRGWTEKSWTWIMSMSLQFSLFDLLNLWKNHKILIYTPKCLIIILRSVTEPVKQTFSDSNFSDFITDYFQ